MTSYNYAALIGEAINSVLNQSYEYWELLIVDDGSNDNSIEIIQSYCNRFPNRIFLFTHENHKNKNIKESIELGISKAKGELIAFLESDDIWREDSLEKRVNVFLQHENLACVYSDIELFSDSKIDRRYSDYISYCRWIGNKNKNIPSDLFDFLIIRNPIATFSNIMIKSSLLDKIKFIKKFEFWSDWQIALQLSFFGDFFFKFKYSVDITVPFYAKPRKFIANNLLNTVYYKVLVYQLPNIIVPHS